MKTRFNTYDIICMVTELQRLVGMRVNQVYDIDNRTYVIRLQRSEEKAVMLLESGNRFHTTLFEWPKNVAPSGFTMKLRKHLKNKRLEKLTQIGIDRIVDLQFGSGEAAYHVILELYDRGNIVLTDHEWTILNVLRPHVEGDKIRFAVKEKYPLDRAKTSHEPPDTEALKTIFGKCKPGDNLKKILNPNVEYGSSVIDHVLLENGLAGNMKVTADPAKGFCIERDLAKLESALQLAESILNAANTSVAKGYIIQKREERPNPSGEEPTFFFTNQEFHPMLFSQHNTQPYAEYDTFDRAVDEFYSALEGQKIDMKTIQVEREAMKKLQNVRKDHEKRVNELESVQSNDKKKAELIARNQELVEQARLAVQAAIANQMSWDDIEELLKTAQENGDPVASRIKQLKLKTNHITLLLDDPFDEDDEDGYGKEALEPMTVDIDLSLTAFANARRYYDQKRSAAKKQQKTIESVGKALKSAERKTKQILKEAHTISNISKARKTYWFEKFFWFISSDNYLVIGGRDQQQNELLVKRYMRSTDAYVHADVSGASSVIVKNPTGAPIPPRTLSEAGMAAVAYSVAWEAKVLTRAWWVHASQVSKSAPTGEYLTTGSFMIRGKKNYILPDQLQFGFSFLFRLEDGCIERHRDERKAVTASDTSDVTSVTSSVTAAADTEADMEDIAVSDDDDDEEESDKAMLQSEKLNAISEETVAIGDSQMPTIHTSSSKTTESSHGEKTYSECSEIETEDTQKETIEKKCQDSQMDTIEKECQDSQIEKESDSESDSDDSSNVLPDTQIKVDHITGQVFIQTKNRTLSGVSQSSEDKLPTFPALPKKDNNVNKKPQKKESKDKETQKKDVQGLKRGQKGKLKKIKQKYKDQDDEDREMNQQMLQSPNPLKDTKKAQKKALAKSGKGKPSGPRVKIPQPAPLILQVDSDVEPELEADNEPEVEQQGADADTETLCQLTGSPWTEDELLFCVPVVAPYSALLNYKYKVKLTPGTSKRGKAAKTAIQVFLRDKTCTPREKDLLKAVKEEDVARNFPGKVKLSAPQLHKHKK